MGKRERKREKGDTCQNGNRTESELITQGGGDEAFRFLLLLLPVHSKLREGEKRIFLFSRKLRSVLSFSFLFFCALFSPPSLTAERSGTNSCSFALSVPRRYLLCRPLLLLLLLLRRRQVLLLLLLPLLCLSVTGRWKERREEGRKEGRGGEFQKEEEEASFFSPPPDRFGDQRTRSMWPSVQAEGKGNGEGGGGRGRGW